MKIKAYQQLLKQNYSFKKMQSNLDKNKTMDLGRSDSNDAGHPRFIPPSSLEESLDESFSDELYYCLQCKKCIPKSFIELELHFRNIKHRSNACVYCTQPVYTYFFKGKKKLFHRCI